MPKAVQSMKVRTYLGQLVDLLDLGASGGIAFEDIVVPLSRECRFSNATKEFYSVAEHSVYVSLMAEKLGGDPWGALWHDAPEAFLRDLSSPVKNLMPGYQDLEHQLMQALALQFGFPYPFQDEIHRADLIMRQVEGLQLMRNWNGLPPTDCEDLVALQMTSPLACLEPVLAFKLFKKRVDVLCERRSQEMRDSTYQL